MKIKGKMFSVCIFFFFVVFRIVFEIIVFYGVVVEIVVFLFFVKICFLIIFICEKIKCLYMNEDSCMYLLRYVVIIDIFKYMIFYCF